MRIARPDSFRLVELPEPERLPGHEVIRVSRAGVDPGDALDDLSAVPGTEVVGTTEDGRRVVALMACGGYAELASASERLIFPVPAEITDGQALALARQGTTAWHLLRTCAHLRSDETVVVHNAASGVGTLATQLARSFGAGRVIATAATQAHRRLVAKLGADVTVDSAPDGLRERLLAANDGRPVDIVLDPVGGQVFEQSLAALAPFGRLVSYGPQPALVDPAGLLAGSRAVIGFWLGDCFAKPEMIASSLSELMGLTSAGRLRPVVGGEYPLSEAGRAHADLLARRTVGKLVLDPSC
jgi:NADPH2:quinone reductase